MLCRIAMHSLALLIFSLINWPALPATPGSENIFLHPKLLELMKQNSKRLLSLADVCETSSNDRSDVRRMILLLNDPTDIGTGKFFSTRKNKYKIAEAIRAYPEGRATMIIIEVPAAMRIDALQEMIEVGQGVRYAEPDCIFKHKYSIKDEQLSWKSTHRSACPLSIPETVFDSGGEAVRKAWNSKPRTVAVLDAGIACTHAQISKQILPEGATPEPGKYCTPGTGYDYVDDDDNPDVNSKSGVITSHGTKIAGLIAGTSIGIAPRVMLKSVRVMDVAKDGTIDLKSFSALVKAIYFAANNKSSILNLSLAVDLYSGSVEKALHDVGNSPYGENGLGVLVVASATSHGEKEGVPWYPAAYAFDARLHAPLNNVLGVGYITGKLKVPQLDRASDNYKHAVNIAAWGILNVSATGLTDECVGGVHGVSYSTALASGAAAAVWGHPQLLSCAPSHIRQFLREGTKRTVELERWGVTLRMPQLDVRFLADADRVKHFAEMCKDTAKIEH